MLKTLNPNVMVLGGGTLANCLCLDVGEGCSPPGGVDIFGIIDSVCTPTSGGRDRTATCEQEESPLQESSTQPLHFQAPKL